MTEVFKPIPLCCPLDGLLLVSLAKTFKCDNGHTFDMARQGYLNLLPVQFKASKDPGDSQSMVSARRKVLEQGYYETLANAVCDLVTARLAQNHPTRGIVMDAGCGEGYYSARLQQHLQSRFGKDSVPVLAMDISKWSIAAAAKSHRQLACVVATNKHPPVLAGSALLITSLFGFASWESWARIQLPGQSVVLADPGPNHLLELREHIYDTVRVHEPADDPAAEQAGYQCVDRQRICYSTDVKSNDALLAILEMTPHGRRVTEDKRAALEAIHSLRLSVDVVIRVFERQNRDPMPLESHQD